MPIALLDPPASFAILDPGLVSRLLGRALQHGGNFAEVYAQRRRSTGLELDDGQIRSAQSSVDLGVGVRVITWGNGGELASVAFAYSDDMSEEALLECADAASYVAGRARGTVTVVARPLAQRSRAHHCDPSRVPSEVPLDDRLAILRRADEAARDDASSTAPGKIEQVLGSWADLDEDVLVCNSDGLVVADRRALCRLSLEVILRDAGGSRTSGSGGGGSRIGFDHFSGASPEQTPESVGVEALRMARAQLGAVAAPVGERVVVLGPASSGVLLHEAVGHGLEADFIRKKTSLFSGRLGERVASELCTVIDDGTIAGKRGSLNVDDEGEPTGRTTLVERGILRGYLSDRLNARMMGIAVTGNGRRQSFRHPPLPRMTNTFLAKGNDDPADILREVRAGLYCRTLGGGQVDIANGNFVFDVKEGYLIEDGKVSAPVKGATLVGNGPEVLQKISRVGHDDALDAGIYTCGKDGQSVPVGVGLPTVRIEGITVGGTGR
jgi:TldD protein